MEDTRQKNLNILLVEDDEFDRESIRRNLNKTNLKYNLTEVDSVDTGIDQVRNNEFDIIFLDYHLSGKNGIELLKFFKRFIRSKKAAVIVISLTDDEEIIFECLSLGAQDFISKENLTPLGLKRAIFNAQVKSKLEKELNHSNSKLKALVEHDALTGLSNRYHYNHTLNKHFKIGNHDREFALMLIDIDNFKAVNDLYGHKTGDELLKEFATMVKSALPPNTMFARTGGDEFAIFMDSRDSNIDLACQAIYKSLETYVSVGEAYQKISISLGYATTPFNATNKTDLYQCADMALHYSKNSNKKTYYGFSNRMYKASKEKAELKAKIKQAFINNTFSINYQPIINGFNESIEGFEALMRLNHNDTFISPSKFIPVLEEMKLIHELGYWMIDEVLALLSKWNKKSDVKLRASINLSPIQLNNEKIIDYIIDATKKYKLNPNQVVFELTETVLLDNPNRIKLILNKLSSHGCRIALDDFGTGFSSLSHLKNFPIDVVKIDKSMLPKDKNDQKAISITNGIVTMLNSLNLDIVAEGVESQFQLDLCKKLEIPKIQGYIYERPLEKEQLEKKYVKKTNKLLDGLPKKIIDKFTS